MNRSDSSGTPMGGVSPESEGPIAQRVEKGSGQRFIHMGSRTGRSDSYDSALRSSVDQEVKPSSVRATICRMKAMGLSSAFISNVLSLPLQFVRTVRPLPPVAD